MSHSKKDHRRSCGGHSCSWIESGHCGQIGNTKAWRKLAKRRHTREMRRESNRITREALELFFAEVDERWTEYDMWGNHLWCDDYEDYDDDHDDYDDNDDYDDLGEDFLSYGGFYEVTEEDSIQESLRGYSLSELIEAVRRKKRDRNIRSLDGSDDGGNFMDGDF